MPMTKEDRDELRTMLKETIKPVVEVQQEQHKMLCGDGTKDNPGLLMKVDRIEGLKLHEHVKDDYAHGIGLRLKVFAFIGATIAGILAFLGDIKKLMGFGGGHGG